MGTRELKEFCALDEGTMELLKNAMTSCNLSARAYDHISEAIQYRSLDQQLWTEAAAWHALHPFLRENMIMKSMLALLPAHPEHCG